MNGTKLHYALHYRAQRLTPIPLHDVASGVCSCAEGSKCNSTGKHPRTNRETAVNATEQDWKRWLKAWPDMNIGILTGKDTGVFAVDIDPRHGGAESLAKLIKSNSPLPATATATTGGNGTHYLFRIPGGRSISNSAGEVAPGIDIRGDGGLIVVEPSVTKGAYQWGKLPTRDDVALPPIWLGFAIASKDRKTLPDSPTGNLGGRPTFTMPADGSVAEGKRNNFLASAAGWLQSQGVKGDELVTRLNAVNVAKCSPPVGASEIEKVVASISRYDIALPANDSEWPDPVNIRESLPPVVAFDPRWLPKALRAWAVDIADRLSVPIDFPAVVMISALGSAMGARVYCKPYANGTWKVPANIWAALVATPGTMKSPVMRECLSPLIAMDRKAADAYTLAMANYTFDKAVYDSNFKVAAKNNGVPPLLPQEPQMTRYLVNDSTYEMLVAIAAVNPRGFMVLRDELAGWFHSLEKDNQKEARGLYLTGWNGTDGYATDRIGRGHTRADQVVISLLGSIQPNVLRGLIENAVSGGSGDDGLVQRFQLMVYPDTPHDWKKVDRKPDYAAEAKYAALIERFTALDCAAIGAAFEPDGTPYLPFSTEAQDVFDPWREGIEARIRAVNTEEHPVMLAHLGKYRSVFPKLALILHLAAGGVGPISKDAAVAASHWIDYLESHARRIYHTATNRTMQCAATLANKIKADRLPTVFTRSDVLLKEWANLRRAEEVGMAVTVLRDMQWLAVTEDRGTGGRPAERYHINPKVKRAA